MIVPARNAARSLPALLESIARQTLPAERFEVVVVDNGSADRTADVARGHGARVVIEPVANRAGARNRGARAARAPLYAFTDADCVAAPGWLERLLACAPTAPLIAGPVLTRVSETPNAIERFEALWRFGQESWVARGWAATANLAVSADAFAAVGGFDPSLRHIGEDVDLCLRARDAGLTLGWCPDAVVEHDAERRLWPTLRRAFRHGYSVNQVNRRFEIGHRAWRDPAPAVVGDRALRMLGTDPARLEPHERRRMIGLARIGYAARVVGSAWAEVTRAR